MPKKTIAATGMLAVAGSGLLTSVPASAQVPTWDGCCGGGSSHSRSGFFNQHRNRSFNANENDAFNRIRLRIHNRNNNIAVARSRAVREREAIEAIEGPQGPEGPRGPRGPRGASGAAGPCIAAETAPGESPTKWVALTRNGRLFLASVATRAQPNPEVLSPFTNISSLFPDKRPACVALSNQGNRLHITVLGTNGRVEERECRVREAGTIPTAADCTPTLTIPFGPTLAQAFAASRQAAAEGISPVRAAIQPQAIEGPGQ
jgi:hypothetical protein